ncbi:sterol desaturase family protein [Pantoea sp. Ap-967]|uniref:sterol desaturase family protein n=1 Tax=Pantoea sp. Ap-967 TaxID=2608362 RepID=UPI001421B19C|nr:sterol desaturase family protein [Pantoea sp. Ap-967]NIE78495.1 sterol desaturase family protein [Pantoea sp. Ap-967]
MQTTMFLVYLLLLVFGSILLEGILLACKRSANWQPAEGLVNAVLGIGNLAVGVLFASVNLALYRYLLEHYSLPLDLGGPLANIGFAFLVYDFLYWFNHWAHHKCALLWCNHLIHHSGTAFNFTTAVRIGWIGNFTVWLFFLPMALLGISLEHYLLVISVQLLYQFFIHTALVPELGLLERVLVTPSQHRVHHASNAIYLDKNFGCFLVIWDKLFGTYQRELPQEPVRYGITTPIHQPASPGYLNFFLYRHCIRSAMAAQGLLGKLRVLFGSPAHTQVPVEQGQPVAHEFAWFDYLPALFVGFYLVVHHAALPAGDLTLAALLFLVVANCAGHSRGTGRSGRWALRGGQLLGCCYLWLSSPQGEGLLLLAVLACCLPWLAVLRKPRLIKE